MRVGFEPTFTARQAIFIADGVYIKIITYFLRKVKKDAVFRLTDYLF